MSISKFGTIRKVSQVVSKMMIILVAGISMLIMSLTAAAENNPCATCHAKSVADLTHSPHGSNKVSCAACHGDGQKHLESPGKRSITTFKDSPTKTESVCGACHTEDHNRGNDAHRAADIACTSCHNIHTDEKISSPQFGLRNIKAGSAMCTSCHQNVFAQFGLGERHRLMEGAITCSSCHDPHNPGRRLAGSVASQSGCNKCHADRDGPYMFEHAASRLDGCVACHEPHGSQNRHMLKYQQVGALCYSCHAEVPQFHLGFSPVAPPRFNERTVCTNCHVSIHGSNLDRSFLR